MNALWSWPDGLVWKITEKPTLRSRKKKYAYFMEQMKPKFNDKILDVGVSPNVDRTTNYFERWYPYPGNIVAITNENKNAFSDFRKMFPKVKLVFSDGRKLPFKDDSFNIVFSNAVIEHVGKHREQKRFIKELVRVGKKIFLTTPNYNFPVDSHTLIPLVHYLPLKPRFWIYKKFGRGYFANLERLNLLTAKKLLSLMPVDMEATIHRLKIFGLTHSIIVVANKDKH